MRCAISRKMADIADWIRTELPKVLEGTLAGEDAIEYMLSMTSFDEVEDFLSELIPEPTSKRRKFIAQLRHKWHQAKESIEGYSLPVQVRLNRPSDTRNQEVSNSSSDFKSNLKQDQHTMAAVSSDVNLEPKQDQLAASTGPHGEEQIYKKSKQEDLVYFSKPSLYSSKRESRSRSKMDSNTKSTTKVQKSYSEPPGFEKKHKFVPLNSSKGQAKTTMHLPGRHVCECLAQKHPLINNCLECGRIVCQQEGTGPCLTCGAFVCSPEDQAMLAKNTKKSLKHKQNLMKHHNIQVLSGALVATDGVTISSQQEKARSHKDKLLEFDKSSVRRTKVIDDESDYFSSHNQWQSEKERETLKQREAELREIRYGSRLNRKVTFDFAGRQIVEKEPLTDMYDERHVADLISSNQSTVYAPPPLNPLVDQDSMVNPTISSQPPKFVVGKKKDLKSKKNVEKPKVTNIWRVQDRQLQEMRDEGKCLSMHQPWASLLVLGIKRVEGRTWYTSHCGKLWIASTATAASPETICAVEEQYRQLYKDSNLKFPNEYSTGKLLGSVDVLDCLPQEDFKAQYNSEESESPFVMVVDRPLCLSQPIPVKGQHKIWDLPSDVHLKAKRM